MLWLCLHFPQLPLSALGLGPEKDADSVVVDQGGSQRWLISDSPACPAGTPLSTALSLNPELRVRVRRPEAEQAMLRSLAWWAYHFGQPVTTQIQDLAEPGRVPRALLWVEVGRSLELFGGLEALRDAVCGELLELGHVAQMAIAPTRAAAALLACAGRSDPLTDPQALQSALAMLPLGILHGPGDRLAALSGVGFRRLSELFAVPREAFTRRFGAEARLELDRLLGHAAEPCEAIVPPDIFRRRFELSAEIEEVERLQFPLKRLCTELQAYLRTHDRGLRSVTLAVMHAGARETRIHACFVDPHRDAQRIFDALRERLERDGLPLAARELVLMAEEFAEAAVPQRDLFDARAGQSQVWNAAIERIRGRLGESRAWTPRAVDDHRPESANARNPAGQALPACARPSKTGVDAARPSFLLREPWPMPPPRIPADAVFERIESGWWDGHEIRRDYTTLEINEGRAWVFRDLITQGWYLHGWWS